MLTLLLELILIVMICFITDLLTYKLIRKMDKKERQKLIKWETNYLNNMSEIWERKKDV